MPNLKHLPIGEGVPETVHAVIEIPKGTRNKIEYDPELEVFKLDRVLFSSVHYPAAYGFIPSTLWHDGDPLDVLVLTDEPLMTGIVLDVIPIGALGMEDDAGDDLKVIAVAAFDPNASVMKDLSGLPDPRKAEIEQFFKTYKTLEKKTVRIGSWMGVKAAQQAILDAEQAFRKEKEK
ncbi:MAG TPA: inorganic diphosphatase [Candidatus Kapabacteria bacterium]|jgi:inorganic pyrophosphatase